jgi:hypothetical protein
MKKYAAMLAGAFVIVLVVGMFGCHPTPKPDALQIAADKAAGATITVAFADSALVVHRRDSVVIDSLARANKVTATRVAVLTAHLKTAESLVPATPVNAPRPEDSMWAVRAVRLKNALDTAHLVIAATAQHDTATMIADSTVRADNARLAGELATTRDTLATFRHVVVPAEVVHKGIQLPHLLQAFSLTVGYGVHLVNVVNGKPTFGLGPQATFGVRIPL